MTPRPHRDLFVQRSLDDLGVPLCDVTFCVLDLETTGGDRGVDVITEVGAVKMRGGQHLGTLQTLVHPGVRIPPHITVLTGITDAMVATAPRIEQVLPSLDEFAHGTVIVGHNVGFDLGFLNAARARRGDPPLPHRSIDTLPLARRLVRDEVPDCRLGTLANRFRLTHRPTHRALDDALATAELLHLLLERAATWGVLGLDDLLALPRLGGHPQAAKLRLTTGVPRQPGVYQFTDARGEVLYVGKASNLRSRVRSYFGSEDRRKIGAMLRETARLDIQVTPDVAVAEILEARLLRTLRPRYNRAGTTWHRYAYVRLSTNEPWPRLTVAASASGPGMFFGPLPSRSSAVLAIEAIHSVFPLRRCTARLGPRFTPTPGRGACTAHQLGRAHCPCSGAADPVAYGRLVAEVVDTLDNAAQVVIDRLTERMTTLAGQRRFEEAAAVRDRAAAFAQLVQRQSTLTRLRRAGLLTVAVGDTTLHLDEGLLVSFQSGARLPEELAVSPPPRAAADRPAHKEAVDEMLVVARVLDRRRSATVIECTGMLASPLRPVRLPERLDLAS